MQFELPILSRDLDRETTVGETPREVRNSTSGCHGCDFPQQAKHCRGTGCLLAILMLTTVCILISVWYEFGQYPAFAKELDFKWGFLMSGANPAPVWLGEFGTQRESLWWKHILRYLHEHDADFAYWSVNGEKYNGISETPGCD